MKSFVQAINWAHIKIYNNNNNNKMHTNHQLFDKAIVNRSQKNNTRKNEDETKKNTSKLINMKDFTVNNNLSII